MGYTIQDTALIEKYLEGVKSVLDVGSQNDYRTGEANPPFVDKSFYAPLGITDYTCVDLAGDNNALQLDLSHPVTLYRQFDLVVDGGSGEHIVQMKGYEKSPFHDGYINSIYPTEVENIELGYYNGWLNKHNFLKVVGIMINVNPKTENWGGHGYTYLTEQFYKDLAANSDYEILELGEWAACGNTVDGWNIYCVLRKKSESFPSFETFKTFDYKPE